MAREWDEVMLWALAEKLSERMDAIREGRGPESLVTTDSEPV